MSGEWEGIVALICGQTLADQAARTLCEAPEVSHDDTQDALGELISIIGGHVLTRVPQPTRTSIPLIVQGDDETRALLSNIAETSVLFDCGGAPLEVMVVEES